MLSFRAFVPYNLRIPIDESLLTQGNLFIFVVRPPELERTFVGTYMKYVPHQLFTEILNQPISYWMLNSILISPIVAWLAL